MSQSPNYGWLWFTTRFSKHQSTSQSKPLPIFMAKFYWNIAMLIHFHIVSMTGFMLQEESWVVVTVTLPTKCKIHIARLFPENICWLLIYRIKSATQSLHHEPITFWPASSLLFPFFLWSQVILSISSSSKMSNASPFSFYLLYFFHMFLPLPWLPFSLCLANSFWSNRTQLRKSSASGSLPPPGSLPDAPSHPSMFPPLPYPHTGPVQWSLLCTPHPLLICLLVLSH